jgi:hypothetical protein
LDLSIVQGPFSVAPCQTLISRFATFSSPYTDRRCALRGECVYVSLSTKSAEPTCEPPVCASAVELVSGPTRGWVPPPPLGHLELGVV